MFEDKLIWTGLCADKPAKKCKVGPVFPLFLHKPQKT